MTFKSNLFGVALAATALIAAGQASAQSTGRFDAAIHSTVRVLVMKSDGRVGYGTGWVISPADKENNAGAAVVVTAAHVVEDAVKVTVIEAGSSLDDQKVATVKSSSSERDVAFLNVRGLDEQPLQMSRQSPSVGDDIDALGFSGASDRGEDTALASTPSLKGGHLSRLRSARINQYAQAPVDQIEFDAPILAGYSGGPLMDSQGHVVGIVVQDGGHVSLSADAQISLGTGMNIAVSADEIIAAAHDAGITPTVYDPNVVSEATVQAPACSSPYISVDPKSGKACTPIKPNGMQAFLHALASPKGIIGGIAVLAALIIAGVIVYILRKPGSPAGDSFGGTTQMSHTPTRLDPLPSVAQRLQLTGRGPAGEAISLSFTSDELIGEGHMLGVAPGGRIPDNRPEPHVSRRHARIFFDGKHFLIDDNKSTNKSRIGNEVLVHGSPRPLVAGDTISLADVRLNVSIN